MKINTDQTTYQPPFHLVLIDATDAFYYADEFDEEKLFTIDSFSDLNLAKKVADSLFVVKNYKWTSLQEMNDLDGGWDARVYDSNYSCVYAAHELYKDKWIDG